MKKTVLVLFVLMLLVAPLFAQGAMEETGPIVLNYWSHEDPNRTRIEEKYIRNSKPQTRTSRSSGPPRPRPR
jgi:multiple sugar transport system substrate-binding protein